MEIRINDISDLPGVAKHLIDHLDLNAVWAFEGEMGAGKTTLILEILKQLGVAGAEGSPTYSLVNEYRGGSGQSIYHFDMYRLNSLEEAMDIGVEEMIYDNNLCLVEWPKKVEELLPEETIWLYLSIHEETHSRILSYRL